MQYFGLFDGQRATGLLRYERGVAEHIGADGAWHPGGIEYLVDEVIDTSEVSEAEAKLIAASLGAKGALT